MGNIMKSKLLSAAAMLTVFSLSAPSVLAGAAAPPPEPIGPEFVSVEAVCATGKGAAKISYFVGGAICFGYAAEEEPGGFGGCEFAGKGTENESIAGEPCALAQAVLNSRAVATCADAGAVPLNVALELSGFKSPTTSLVLPNGNVQHQWNIFCPPPPQ
jgi:hypothetical protein